MHVSVRGLKLIESFEGYSYHAYWDQWGHVWTVGYGETEGVGPASTQTVAEAEADLRRRLEREYEPSIRALGVELNQNQWDALCSFVWNLGPGSMSWDVGRYIRARSFHAAANAMLQYDHAGGVQLAGLTRRRREEAALFLAPVAVAPDPHHYARFDDTVRDLGHGHHGAERGLAQEYDRKREHPWLYPRRLKRLKDDMHVLAKRLEHVEAESHDSTSFDRSWRLSQLNGRAAGLRYAA